MRTATVRMKGVTYRKKEGVTKTMARKKWVAGFMGSARKHPMKYRKHGVKKIRFVHGKYRTTRSI